MTVLDTIKHQDELASELVLQVLEDGESMAPAEVVAAVRGESPELPSESVRRATWNLINEDRLSLTHEYRVRLNIAR